MLTSDMTPTRRAFLLFSAAFAAAGGHFSALASETVRVDKLWPVYRDRFMLEDGRVIDTGNSDISHSEGQGWGMLLAGAAGDWTAFDQIWRWTADNLRWSKASLFAWKWDPKAGEVVDPNNASDGDILIAWALARAAHFTQKEAYSGAATSTAIAVRRMLTDQVAGDVALLPGFGGFHQGGVATINLSYYVFPAFAQFEKIDPNPAWRQLSVNGAALARRARFGTHSLPPDWLAVEPDGALAPAESWPPRFGFDAVRIPLYLYWAGYKSAEDIQPFHVAWAGPNPPAWFRLTPGLNAEYAASEGVQAIAQLIQGQSPRAETLWSAVKEGDYYTASLAMLASLAAEEQGLK